MKDWLSPLVHRGLSLEEETEDLVMVQISWRIVGVGVNISATLEMLRLLVDGRCLSITMSLIGGTFEPQPGRSTIHISESIKTTLPIPGPSLDQLPKIPNIPGILAPV